MPQAIPKGLTRAAVLQALADLDAGLEHPFGPPTDYELVHEGRRYAPKAVIGLACRSLLGRLLRPEEFSRGETLAPGLGEPGLRSHGTVHRAARQPPAGGDGTGRCESSSADARGGPSRPVPGRDGAIAGTRCDLSPGRSVR
jgi:hypothetical protein